MKFLIFILGFSFTLSAIAVTPYLGSAHSYEYVRVDGTSVCLILLKEEDSSVVNGLVTSVASCESNKVLLSNMIQNGKAVFTDEGEISPVESDDLILEYLREVSPKAHFYHLERVESLTVLKSSSFNPTPVCLKKVLTQISSDYASETCSRLGQNHEDCIRQKNSCGLTVVDKYDDDDNGTEETVIARLVCDVGMGYDSTVGYNAIFKTFDDSCQFDYNVSFSYDDSVN